jgi:DNA-binding MarR family transcriptional regulator
MENVPESQPSAYLYQSAHLNYGFTIEKTMKRIKQNLQRRFNNHHFGVTVDQWVVLDCIHQTTALSQNEIAESTFKDAPTVTRIIDQLCTKGLAVRDPDPLDRRRFNISLTEKGHKKVAQMQPVVLAMRREGWQGLTEEDYHLLMRVLNTIFGNLD